jgi:hypothetical protein
MSVRNSLVPTTIVGIVAIVLIWAIALRPIGPVDGGTLAPAAGGKSAAWSGYLASARGR